MIDLDRAVDLAIEVRARLPLEVDDCVDLSVVAEEFNIKVKRTSFSDDVEGACKAHGLNKLVVINEQQKNKNRERFTISHEYGHLFLGHGTRICKSTFFRSYRPQKQTEQEANAFAAELLLPQRAVENALKSSDLTFKLIQELSTKYETTLSVAGIRAIQCFNDYAVLIWHNREKILWKCVSEGFPPRWSIGDVPSDATCHRLDPQNTHMTQVGDSDTWLCVDNLMCEEEVHYFHKRDEYMTILKFYEA